MANDIIANLSSADDLRSCLQTVKPKTTEGKQQAIKNIAEAFAYEKENQDRASVKKMLESKYRSLIKSIKHENGN